MPLPHRLIVLAAALAAAAPAAQPEWAADAVWYVPTADGRPRGGSAGFRCPAGLDAVARRLGRLDSLGVNVIALPQGVGVPTRPCTTASYASAEADSARLSWTGPDSTAIELLRAVHSRGMRLVAGITLASAEPLVEAATRQWMDPNADGDASDGVDGWLVRDAADVPAALLSDWYSLVRSVNAEAIIVVHERVAPRADAIFSSREFAAPFRDFLAAGRMSASAFSDTIASMADGSRAGGRLLAVGASGWPDSGGESDDLLRIALLLHATLPGAPVILGGAKADEWIDEPLAAIGAPRDVGLSPELLGFYSDVLALRRARPALRRGTFRSVAADDRSRTLAFARDFLDETLVVLVNAGDEEASFDLSDSGGVVPMVPIAASRGDVADIPSLVATFHDDGTTTYRNPVPARTAVVLRRVTREDIRPAGVVE